VGIWEKPRLVVGLLKIPHPPTALVQKFAPTIFVSIVRLTNRSVGRVMDVIITVNLWVANFARSANVVRNAHHF